MDPFKIDGPATISFSGGRTSAYMLWRIVQAHGGKLPGDVHVVFANTGKEVEKTLRFVHECGARWGVPIVWVEWRDGKPGFEIVGYNSASRKGEPFEALIRKKKRLPNAFERWCTAFLKVKTMHAYLKSIEMEVGSFAEVIGLRHDEGHRILQGEARAINDGRSVVYPLASAKVVKADVMAFWASQDFDLGLKPWEGNCNLCFLKGKKIKKRILREQPEAGPWWRDLETEFGFFDKRDTIAELMEEIRRSPDMFDDYLEDDAPEQDSECGDMCGGDTAEDIEILKRRYLARAS